MNAQVAQTLQDVVAVGARRHLTGAFNLPGHIFSLTGHDGLTWLYEQAKRMQSCVEVGCWRGAGIYALCSGCAGPVTAVDHWQGSPDPGDATHHPAKVEDVYAQFLANVGHFPNLHILKMPSVEAATHFAPKSVDLIYVDAGHDPPSVDGDFEAWFPICRTLFCGHDYSHAPVRKALDRLGLPVDRHPADIWSVRCDA